MSQNRHLFASWRVGGLARSTNSVVVVFLCMVFGWAASAGACPGCKESLFDPAQLPQRLATARGYALSIAVMLSVPAVLIGGVAALIFRAARNRRR